MKGIVEVYCNYGTPQQTLIEKSYNLVVDKGGEMIADLMTLPVDGSAISSASAIYDASNFTIQAISFGKAVSGYTQNAHGTSPVNSRGAVLTQIWVDASATTAPSSYSPTLHLPSFPDPLDEKLEVIPSGAITVSSSSGISAIESFGQNINYLQYGTSEYGGLFRSYIRAGAWPRRTGDTIALKYDDNTTNRYTIVSATVSGNFNTVSSMDINGFVKLTSTGNSLSGLQLSSNSNFSSTGEIIYKVSIASADALVANVYGGITQLGLWGLDLKYLLSNGRNPPYAFHPYTNPLKYRLFSKKTFNKNIVGIQDSGTSAGFLNYGNLTIIWRIFFL